MGNSLFLACTVDHNLLEHYRGGMGSDGDGVDAVGRWGQWEG